MIKTYRIVLLGLIKRKEEFKQEMSRLGVSPETVDQIVHKTPVVLKGNMSLRDARQYADAVQHAGGRVNIQENGLFEEPERINRTLDVKSLENFTMCPECGFKQLKAEVCVKCGSILVDHT